MQQFFSTNYRQKNLKTVDLWTYYVKKNFGDIKESVLKDDDNDDNDDNDDDDDDEESNNDEEVEEAEAEAEAVEEEEEVVVEEEEEEEEEYEDIQQRTCSASLSSIIRKDLPPVVRQAFVDNVNTTMIQVSNYVADFSKQVLKSKLQFNDYGFAKQDRKVALVPQEGNSLDPVLPVGYLDCTARVPKPVDADCLQDADFSSECSQLFQLPHLELIHSSYFGTVGGPRVVIESVSPPQGDNPSLAC